MQVALILCVAVRDSLHFAANYLEFYVLSCSYHTFINRIARNCIDLWTKLLLKLFLPYSTTFFKIVSVSFVVCVFCYTFFSFGICHCLNVHDWTRCFAYSDYAFFNNFDYWCGNFLAASDACVLVTGFAFFFVRWFLFSSLTVGWAAPISYFITSTTMIMLFIRCFFHFLCGLRLYDNLHIINLIYLFINAEKFLKVVLEFDQCSLINRHMEFYIVLFLFLPQIPSYLIKHIVQTHGFQVHFLAAGVRIVYSCPVSPNVQSMNEKVLFIDVVFYLACYEWQWNRWNDLHMPNSFRVKAERATDTKT